MFTEEVGKEAYFIFTSMEIVCLLILIFLFTLFVSLLVWSQILDESKKEREMTERLRMMNDKEFRAYMNKDTIKIRELK